MSDWQPIETAPKDGTYILAWFAPPEPDPDDFGEPVIVRYVDHPTWAWAGMADVSGSYNTTCIRLWQPLPAPPEGAP